MLDRLRQLFGGAPRQKPAASPPATPPAPAAPVRAAETPPAAPPAPAAMARPAPDPVVAAAPQPEAEAPTPSTSDGADKYLARVQAKIAKLAEDFAAGTINRAQFQELYAHYQREIRTVEQVIDSRQGDWRDVTTEGQSVFIRRQKLARAEGYAIYENESGMPLATLGKFEVDPELIVPMLSSYRAAAAEMFGGGLRSTGIENGRWLCFVPGQHTTLLALFTVEPAPRQLAYLEGLHTTFESANRHRLAAPPVDPAELVFPHEYSLGMWRSA